MEDIVKGRHAVGSMPTGTRSGSVLAAKEDHREEKVPQEQRLLQERNSGPRQQSGGREKQQGAHGLQAADDNK